MSILSTMGIARESLSVSEAAIHVVSNNISNMNTDGYSRERVVLTEETNYSSLSSSNAVGQAYSGAGVSIDKVERYTDAYLLNYYRQQNTQSNYSTEYKTVASSVETMTNELKDTSGLASAFSTFYSAVNTLNSNPTSESARSAYVQSAANIATQLNQMYTNIDDLKTSLVGKVSTDSSGNVTKEGISSSKMADSVTQVNSLLKQIVNVNEDILKTSSDGTPPNTLLDKRDAIITELSNYLPVSVTENSNGTNNISINGLNVIQGTDLKGTFAIDENEATADTPSVLKLQTTDSSGAKVYTTDSVNSYITTGTMGAILNLTAKYDANSTDFSLSGVLKGLDTLASGFADALNKIQTGDPNGDGTTALAIDTTTNKLVKSTENMFTTSDGSTTITAENITVNSNLVSDPFKVAAARADTTSATYDATSVGNNTNSTLMLNSRTTKLSALGNSAPEDYLSSYVGNIGVQVDEINTKYSNQSTVLTEVQNQLTSLTGVDMNEEIIDLTKFQRQYESSARIFSVCNSLLNTLVHLGE